MMEEAALGGLTTMSSHGALNTYRENVTLCRGRGAGVFGAVMQLCFYQAGYGGAKKAGVTVCV
jgi:hypothetical protein